MMIASSHNVPIDARIGDLGTPHDPHAQLTSRTLGFLNPTLQDAPLACGYADM